MKKDYKDLESCKKRKLIILICVLWVTKREKPGFVILGKILDLKKMEKEMNLPAQL